MFALWEDGESVASIAAALDVSKGWVYRHLKRADLFVPSATPLPKVEERYRRIRTLFARGYRLTEIQEITGWSRATLRRTLNACQHPPMRRPIREEERSEAIRLWNKHKRILPVARQLHRDWAAVRRILREAGIYEPAGKSHPMGGNHPWRQFR